MKPLAEPDPATPSAVKLRAHLCFGGTCEEAFRFYQQVLGGSLTTMLRYGDSPLAEQTPAPMRNKIRASGGPFEVGVGTRATNHLTERTLSDVNRPLICPSRSKRAPCV